MPDDARDRQDAHLSVQLIREGGEDGHGHGEGLLAAHQGHGPGRPAVRTCAPDYVVKIVVKIKVKSS